MELRRYGCNRTSLLPMCFSEIPTCAIGSVCFDVDSTVCVDEGIDELARFMGVENNVEHITSRAMNGELDFTEALNTRMAIINPRKADLDRFIAANPPRITTGFREVIDRLQFNGINVFLVSGGFDPIVQKVAECVGICMDNVYSNRILFAEDGSYLGLDPDQPTYYAHGKADVVAEIKQRCNKDVIIVGDGMTDARACPPAALFIGFGANVDRPAVRKATPYFCKTVSELISLFETLGLIK